MWIYEVQYTKIHKEDRLRLVGFEVFTAVVLKSILHVIRGRWPQTSASAYRSITCRTGKAYGRKQEKLISSKVLCNK
jgi:hypothetical protein